MGITVNKVSSEQLEKFENLKKYMQELGKFAIAFSGGVDSSFLLYAAKQAGVDVGAYFVKGQFQPEFELQDAKELAESIGAEINILRVDVLQFDDVTVNPADRCYYCKNHVFGLIQENALADGYTVILDGTNASDDADDRPGMKALAEMKVKSPLRECGLTKADVRALSKDAGLFTWEKPSYACLATRIPTGETITGEALANVEAAEGIMFDFGFSDFRIRKRGEAGLIQLPADQVSNLLEKKAEIQEAIKPYFADLYLDLKNR